MSWYPDALTSGSNVWPTGHQQSTITPPAADLRLSADKDDVVGIDDDDVELVGIDDIEPVPPVLSVADIND